MTSVTNTDRSLLSGLAAGGMGLYLWYGWMCKRHMHAAIIENSFKFDLGVGTISAISASGLHCTLSRANSVMQCYSIARCCTTDTAHPFGCGTLTSRQFLLVSSGVCGWSLISPALNQDLLSADVLLQCYAL